jgi:hypothetical protein
MIETGEVDAPAICGFWRKHLLLPAGLLERFSREELRHVFLHELAHLKRRDLEVGWVVALLQALHWFNPILRYAFKCMRADRELATDALVLSVAGENQALTYGETIIRLLENFTRPSAAASAVGILEGRTVMKRRMAMIAGYKKGCQWPAAALALALIPGLGIVSLTTATEKSVREATGRNAGFLSAAEGKTTRQAKATNGAPVSVGKTKNPTESNPGRQPSYAPERGFRVEGVTMRNGVGVPFEVKVIGGKWRIQTVTLPSGYSPQVKCSPKARQFYG